MPWRIILGIALLILPHAAPAQSSGDVAGGLAYALNVCSECHAVRGGVRLSPHRRAPAFQVVADTRGMTEMALRVWLQSPHPSMPMLVIPENDADHLIAYILNLKRTRGQHR